MSFNLMKFFIDVFSPEPGEVVTIMYDMPHGTIIDNADWEQRRKMAIDWHKTISSFARDYRILVNPLVTYMATGTHNSDLPDQAQMGNITNTLEDIISKSTIVLSLPEFSASAPLIHCTKKYPKLRVGSMPGITKSMEETGLSANYQEVNNKCLKLGPLFDKAQQVEVLFSTDHQCVFDISNNLPPLLDNGLLPPNLTGMRFTNLPAGEVCTCPNEAEDRKTNGKCQN